MVPRPFEQVIQEVDEAGVCPLQVLYDHENGQMLRQALEEEAPTREQLFFREDLRGRKPQQLAEPRGDELTIAGIGNPAFEARAEPFGHYLRRVFLADQ